MRRSTGRSFYRECGPRVGMDTAEKMLATCNPLHRIVILLAASNGGEPIRGRTKLQKMVFMLTRGEGWEDFPCGYAAGERGPHSDVVEEEASRLEEAGVLHADDGDISVTQLGREVASKIAVGEDRLTLTMIDEHKDMFNDLPADELLAYVYTAYPDASARSSTYDRIMPDQERHVMSMLKKEKITSERASELLGRTLEDVMRLTGRLRTRARGGRV